MRSHDVRRGVSKKGAPADIAAQLLARDRALFQELHAERAVAKYRSFAYYVAGKKPRIFTPLHDLTALEATLNDWYAWHQRGRSARVFWRQKDHEFWFYIRHGGSCYLPCAFTEQGVAMLSSVLRSERAVQVNIAIMRAFVQLRQVLGSHAGLSRKLAELEQGIEGHDDAIRSLFKAT
jgi:hypothetical protein